eukprot:7387132-Prymnesium_polylepis.1
MALRRPSLPPSPALPTSASHLRIRAIAPSRPAIATRYGSPRAATLTHPRPHPWPCLSVFVFHE